MAATIPAPYNPSMPYQGQFSAPTGTVVDGAFLNAAQAARYSLDPVFRKYYYCNLIQRPSFGTWLMENMGYAETCYKNYSLVRSFPTDNIVHLKNTLAVVVPASPGTVALPIANSSHYVGGAYVYPQVGDALLLPPNGTIAIITAVTPGVNSTTITVRLKNSAVPVTIPIGADVIVLTGKFVADCECPTGIIRFEDSPIEQPVSMITIMEPSGRICGDALLACQNVKYQYSYMGADGNRVETQLWYGGQLQKMYQNHEESKMYNFVFDPTFGIIPTLMAKSIRWNWADPNILTVGDIADLKAAIQLSGLNCFEFTFFLGSKAFSSAQTLANTLGDGKISYGTFNPEDCKWINLHFCTISISGMTIHFYEENNFGNGKALGALGFDYKNRGIGMPMCDKPANEVRRGNEDNKLFTVTYFRDTLGRLHDNLTDSNGILNGPTGRNTFGTGCDFHEFSIKSSFAVEVSCPQAWVLVNFPA